MKFRLAALLYATIAAVFITGFHSTQSQTKKPLSDSTLSDPERDLLNEINLPRAHPQTYAAYLEKMRPRFNGKQYSAGGGRSLRPEEGGKSVDAPLKFFPPPKPP